MYKGEMFGLHGERSHKKKNYVKEEFYNKILTGQETEAIFKKYD